jgi:hypothetical protein
MLAFNTKQAPRRRDDVQDTDWSDPGSTKGIPDRWQWRSLGGLHLTVGNNARRAPDYIEFFHPESRTPWKVYAWTPNEHARGQLDLMLVASGTAGSSAEARDACERAALAWEVST